MPAINTCKYILKAVLVQIDADQLFVLLDANVDAGPNVVLHFVAEFVQQFSLGFEWRRLLGGLVQWLLFGGAAFDGVVRLSGNATAIELAAHVRAAIAVGPRPIDGVPKALGRAHRVHSDRFGVDIGRNIVGWRLNVGRCLG